MRIRQLVGQFDLVLFTAAVGLAAVGVLGVFSVGGAALGWSQAGRVGLGLLVCMAALYFDYRRLMDLSPLIYLASLAGLVAVLFVGIEVNGNQNWLSIAGFTFQPSELAKITCLLLLVRVLAENDGEYLSRRLLITAGLITAVPMALIILQKDLGTAFMYLPMAGALLFVAGIRARAAVVVTLIMLAAAPVVWIGLKDYQRQRVLVTLDPDLDPLGFGYQTRQSQIAIGSGGLFGRGLGQGLQSQLGFVPESHTDFIFTLLAEEIGFFGAVAILLTYLLVISRLVTLGRSAKDRTGILLVAGVLGLLASHVVVNIGMALGLLPPIGIPLPLLSYGGSSALSVFAALGLALNVGVRRYMYL
jgi:rod shape determining protein RodA